MENVGSLKLIQDTASFGFVIYALKEFDEVAYSRN